MLKHYLQVLVCFPTQRIIEVLSRHALPVSLPTEKDNTNSAYNAERVKRENLTLITTPEQQKEYIDKKSDELAKLYKEIEESIDKLTPEMDLDRDEENIIQELEMAEKDNEHSLKKLESVKEAARINHTKI